MTSQENMGCESIESELKNDSPEGVGGNGGDGSDGSDGGRVVTMCILIRKAENVEEKTEVIYGAESPKL